METKIISKGALLRKAMQKEKPLQIVGTINAYSVLLAAQAGFRALYLSGSGVASASYGLPDLGITSLDNVLEDVRRITSATDLPLLVDADTGWGNAFNIARCVHQMIATGAAGMHIEDQIANKRCGHRPKKSIVTKGEMVDRIKAAVDARTDNQFVIMARTDAITSEGLEAAIERAQLYIEAGADTIFPEAITSLEDYRRFKNAVNVPILANITEFGKTPLFSVEELKQAGVDIALYPLSAFRAMSKAAQHVYHTIRKEGSQKNVIDSMQTRESLYEVLDYYAYEKKLDELFGGN